MGSNQFLSDVNIALIVAVNDPVWKIMFEIAIWRRNGTVLDALWMKYKQCDMCVLPGMF